MSNSPEFTTGLRSIARGDILIPPLRAYLSDPEFRGFDVKVRGIGGRPYDGRFHPSEHPSWSVKALWLYLVAPSLLIREPLNPSAVLAMTAGSVWHGVIERSLLDIGLLVTNEVAFHDDETLGIGKADGLVKAHSGQTDPEELFEFKTMRDMILRKMNSVADFIDGHYGYYLQAHEYMRMSGYRKMRFLIMAPTMPFEMKEFVIQYDVGVAEHTAGKYRAAIQMAADKTVPICDGCKKGTFCPSRGVCESATSEQIRGWIGG